MAITGANDLQVENGIRPLNIKTTVNKTLNP